MTRGPAAEAALARWLSAPTLVLGIGHAWCGDDAAGPLVCAHSAAPFVIDCGDAPERFLGKAEEPAVAQVLLVDAMEFGGTPGEAAFGTEDELRECVGTTHTTGLAVLARFITASSGKPVAVLGIQPADTRLGAGVNPMVQATAERLGAVLARQAAAEWEAAWTPS